MIFHVPLKRRGIGSRRDDRRGCCAGWASRGEACSVRTMTAYGTRPTFSGCRVQVRLPTHCRRSGPNVGSTSHSRRSAGMRRRSVHDPGCSLTRGLVSSSPLRLCRVHCSLRSRGWALCMMALEDAGGSMCESCAFRNIRSLIPTTSGQPFRSIRSP